ncbi:hypothetical protein MAAFP003_5805, partial [Mycobacterium ahvazicum]
MADEQPLRTRPDEATGEYQRPPIAVPAEQLSPPAGPAFVRRHPVGVAVGAGATGFIFGALLTALFLTIFLAGPLSPGPFPMPAPPPCGFAPGGCGAFMPPPPGWAGPAGGWAA